MVCAPAVSRRRKQRKSANRLFPSTWARSSRILQLRNRHHDADFFLAVGAGIVLAGSGAMVLALALSVFGRPRFLF